MVQLLVGVWILIIGYASLYYGYRVLTSEKPPSLREVVFGSAGTAGTPTSPATFVPDSTYPGYHKGGPQ